MMATYMPSPGVFRGADADPEATLELFDDYLEKMDKVYRLSRGEKSGVRGEGEKKRREKTYISGGTQNTAG